MQSTDHDLNNPTRTDLIDLLERFDAMKFMKTEGVTQDFYDRMGVHDPHTAYVITDHPGKVYYGDSLVPMERNKPRYLLGQERRGEWILYMNTTSEGQEKIYEVCKYDDPQKAIEALETCNRVGSHHAVNIQIYDILRQYISKDISINSAIFGIISLFGYKDAPDLQRVIQTAFEYGAFKHPEGSYGLPQRDLPVRLRDEISRIAKQEPNSLYNLYSRFYNVFVKYALFKDESLLEDPTFANLHMPIENFVSEVYRFRGILV